jgi:hypothetical protein
MLLAATSALAQEMKPGLWELSGRITTDSGRLETEMKQVEESLKQLTPEQKKRLKANVVGLHNGVTSMRICITPELALAIGAEQEELPQDATNCQLLSEQRSETTRSKTFLCEAPILEIDQLWKMERSSGRLLETSANYLMELELEAGQPERVHLLSRWRFVSSLCGNVRPAPPGFTTNRLR